MFQDFRRRTTPETGAPRLAALRAAMAEAGVDAFLVPRADAHQGENVAPRDERLAWLTGFTGSAGMALVTRDRAGIFVDGRYRLQVRDQVDTALFTILRIPEDKPADWLLEVMPGGGRLGFDPWLHTAKEIEALEAALGPRQIGLVRTPNLVDAAWPDQPPPPAAAIVPYPDDLAGRTSAEKRAAIARGLVARDLAAAVLTLPDSIAWLLNVRGGDIDRTPVPLAFAILHADGRVALFTDPAKADDALRAHLGPEVEIRPEADFGPALDALRGRVAVDEASAPVWVGDRLADADAERRPRARPLHPAQGDQDRRRDRRHPRRPPARRRRDGGIPRLARPHRARGRPDRDRRGDEARGVPRRHPAPLRDISFETICGAGPNGAIVHYRVTEASNRQVAPGELLLVDSRRPVPRRHHRHHPHRRRRPGAARRRSGPSPSSSRASSPCRACAGPRASPAATSTRWPAPRCGRAGHDYDHGTGHGVGAYLGVHEGPQSLSRRGLEPLLPGMILSIEPGYYREGAFGIRIETLAVVTPPETPAGGDRPMLGFETLTLAPIDRRLIDATLLEPAERAWLDAYHARVLEAVSPLVEPDTRRWLRAACAPL